MQNHFQPLLLLRHLCHESEHEVLCMILILLGVDRQHSNNVLTQKILTMFFILLPNFSSKHFGFQPNIVENVSFLQNRKYIELKLEHTDTRAHIVAELSKSMYFSISGMVFDAIIGKIPCDNGKFAFNACLCNLV